MTPKSLYALPDGADAALLDAVDPEITGRLAVR